MLFYFNFFQSHFSALSLFLEVIYNSLRQHIKKLIASAFKNCNWILCLLWTEQLNLSVWMRCFLLISLNSFPFTFERLPRSLLTHGNSTLSVYTHVRLSICWVEVIFWRTDNMPTAEIDVTDVEITLSFRSDLLQTTRSILAAGLWMFWESHRGCVRLYIHARGIAYSSNL